MFVAVKDWWGKWQVGKPRWPSRSPVNDYMLKTSRGHALASGGLVWAADAAHCALGLAGFLFLCRIIISLGINSYNEHLPCKVFLITSLVFLLLTPLRALPFLSVIEGLAPQT